MPNIIDRADLRTVTTQDIRREHSAAGFHFFDQAAMRFFSSRVLPTVHTDGHRLLFVTSERDTWIDAPRRYTVREFDPTTAEIITHGFQQYPTAADAHAAARDIPAAEGCQICQDSWAFRGESV